MALFSVRVMGVPGVGARSLMILSDLPSGSRASSRMPSVPFSSDSMVFSRPVSPTPQSSVMPTSCAATGPSGYRRFWVSWRVMPGRSSSRR